MKKITIILLFAFFASFVNAQIHPITGILPAPDAKYMLISVDTFSADRMNYDSIWFSIVGDSLHLTNDIAINASTLVNTNIDTTNTIVTITALLDTLQGFRDTLTTGSTGYWSSSGNYTYPTTLTDSIGVGTATPTKQFHLLGHGLISNSLTIGSDLSGFEQYGFTVNTSNGGILLNRTTTSDAYIRLSNSNNDGGQLRTFGSGTLSFTDLSGGDFSSFSSSLVRHSAGIELKAGNAGSGGSLNQIKLGYTSGSMTSGWAYSQAIKTRHASGGADNNGIEFWTWQLSDGTYGTPSVFGAIIENGKLGIGTQDPSYPLHVVGQTYLKGAGATSATDALIVKNSAATSLLHIEDGGNVGIGTSSPDSKLDVEGTTGTSPLLYVHQLDAAAYMNSFEVQAPNMTATQRVYWGIGQSATTNNRLVNTFYYAGSGSVDNRLEMQFTGSTGITYLAADGRWGFGTVPTTGIKVDILGSGSTSSTTSFRTRNSSGSAGLLVRDDGNVGIGTAAPTARLQIKGAGATSATDALIIENSASTSLLHIEDGGNVGIGTATPKSNFQLGTTGTLSYVNGTAFHTSFNAYYDGDWKYMTTGPSVSLQQLYQDGSIRWFDSAAGTADGIISWTENARLTNAGNLGIGVSGDATSRLQLKGSGATDVTDALIVQNSASTNLLHIENGGSVGINTSDPNNTYKLDLRGHMLIKESSPRIVWDDDGASGRLTYMQAFTNGIRIYDGTSGGATSVQFWDGSTGFVGINDDTPDATLDIHSYGSTSATDALIVQNSASTSLLHIEDGGLIGIGTSTPLATTQITGPNYTHTSGSKKTLQIGQSYVTSSGTGTYNAAYFAPTINQSGTATGITTGLKIDPILTASDDWRALYITNLSNSGFGIYQESSLPYNYFAGSTGIGTAAPAELLHVHKTTSAASLIAITNSTTGTTGTDGVRIGLDASEDLIINQKETSAIAFSTNNTNRMKILSGGDVEIYNDIVLDNSNNVRIVVGAGSPEGVVTAGIGSTYHRNNGSTGTSFYVKESGTGNTGWIAK